MTLSCPKPVSVSVNLQASAVFLIHRIVTDMLENTGTGMASGASEQAACQLPITHT